MKNRKISIKTVIIVILIGIIIALVIMNLNNKNNNIKQQLMKKEQLGETTQDNSYIEMQKHMSEVSEKEQKLTSFKSAIASAITDMGVETSEEADVDTITSNIRSISRSTSNFDLLWTNPDAYTTTDFTAQTIELDLSKYDYVFISAYYRGLSSDIGTDYVLSYTKIPIGSEMLINATGNTNDLQHHYNWYGWRVATVSTTGITFGRGGSAGAGASTNDDKRCTPYQIFGCND